VGIRELVLSQIILENHNTSVAPITKDRNDLVGKYYDFGNDYGYCTLYHGKKEILEAFELSFMSSPWCGSGYVWEGIVVRCKGVHYATREDTIYNYTFLGSRNEKRIYDFDGVGDHLSVPDNEDWELSDGDITVDDGWAYRKPSLMYRIGRFIGEIIYNE
jgi:hypothetical protein